MIEINENNYISKIINSITVDDPGLIKVNNYIETIRESKLKISTVDVGYSIDTESFKVITDENDEPGRIYLIATISLDDYNLIKFSEKLKFLRENFMETRSDLTMVELKIDMADEYYKELLRSRVITELDLPTDYFKED